VTGNTTSLQTDFDTTTDVTISVFTVALRKVQERTFTQIAPGGSITLGLTDDHGTLLANGLYYVAIEAQGERFITKLLVLR
jgi:hypothetical protein